MSEGWHVYIARCADGTFYTGVARDLTARLAAHNAGRGAKYTRTRLPIALIYREPAADRAAALRREHEIKCLSRAAKALLARHAVGRRGKV
jgi:putative endonuclease